MLQSATCSTGQSVFQQSSVKGGITGCSYRSDGGGGGCLLWCGHRLGFLLVLFQGMQLVSLLTQICCPLLELLLLRRWQLLEGSRGEGENFTQRTRNYFKMPKNEGIGGVSSQLTLDVLVTKYICILKKRWRRRKFRILGHKWAL